jgi:hypothetical protein
MLGRPSPALERRCLWPWSLWWWRWSWFSSEFGACACVVRVGWFVVVWGFGVFIGPDRPRHGLQRERSGQVLVAVAQRAGPDHLAGCALVHGPATVVA